ncbi:hypothetical protein D3C78_879120 [compost metagenome]
MSEEQEYPLKDWQSSTLLKEAADFLRIQPEYVTFPPDARAEMTRFCHAVRRELREVHERIKTEGIGPLDEFCNEYKLAISTTDYCRYVVMVHDYPFVIILDIKLNEGTVHADQILFSEKE